MLLLLAFMVQLSIVSSVSKTNIPQSFSLSALSVPPPVMVVGVISVIVAFCSFQVVSTNYFYSNTINFRVYSVNVSTSVYSGILQRKHFVSRVVANFFHLHHRALKGRCS